MPAIKTIALMLSNEQITREFQCDHNVNIEIHDDYMVIIAFPTGSSPIPAMAHSADSHKPSKPAALSRKERPRKKGRQS